MIAFGGQQDFLIHTKLAQGKATHNVVFFTLISQFLLYHRKCFQLKHSALIFIYPKKRDWCCIRICPPNFSRFLKKPTKLLIEGLTYLVKNATCNRSLGTLISYRDHKSQISHTIIPFQILVSKFLSEITLFEILSTYCTCTYINYICKLEWSCPPLH